MGYYIEVPEPRFKARQLETLHGALRLLHAPDAIPKVETGDVLICVVQTGDFDAAAICYSNLELEEFGDPADERVKSWLIMDLDKVLELVPEVANVLQ